jgi:ElaB/YqjD/DUF883 family membrane-anchored ribosome-binding protein
MDQFIDQNLENREKTRAALVQKVDLLEARLRDSAEHFNRAIKQGTDLPYQVKKRPWKMFGLALAVGSVIGRLSSRGRPEVNARDSVSRRLAAGGGEDIFARATENGRMIGSADRYAQQVSVLKGATLGAIATIISELVRHALPPLLARVERYAKGNTETQASNREINAGTPFPNQ